MEFILKNLYLLFSFCCLYSQIVMKQPIYGLWLKRSGENNKTLIASWNNQ